jgi:serine/threonine protein phosphatase PrpC
VGLRRAQNEDSYACWISDPSSARGALLVVADGMGGANAGEIASQLAVETLTRIYREGGGNVEADLLRSMEEANRAVFRQSLLHPEMKGMGTTCTAVALHQDQAFYVHVGDSRAYRVRGGRIQQLTHDHSLVAQLVQSQHLTPEQARVDPRRNVVTRSLGIADVVEIDARQIDPLRDRDTLLICTDGLHGLVDDQELARHTSADDLEEASHALIALANQRGGPDNITLILARWIAADATARSSRDASEDGKG